MGDALRMADGIGVAKECHALGRLQVDWRSPVDGSEQFFVRGRALRAGKTHSASGMGHQRSAPTAHDALGRSSWTAANQFP